MHCYRDDQQVSEPAVFYMEINLPREFAANFMVLCSIQQTKLAHLGRLSKTMKRVTDDPLVDSIILLSLPHWRTKAAKMR